MASKSKPFKIMTGSNLHRPSMGWHTQAQHFQGDKPKLFSEMSDPKSET